MHADLKYVESIEKEIDELESDKAEFSDMYDVILQECISKDVMCSYLMSLSVLDALDELQCLYLHKVKECDCLVQNLSKQTESVSKKVHTDLLQRFAKVEKHSISFEIALQNCKEQIVQLILFIVDFGCTKHMTGNLKLLCNFVEKFLGTVRFGNDQFAPILGYRDFFKEMKSTCFVRDLHGNNLLTGNRRSDLYTISLQESTSSTPLCLMAKATPTQAWLWHRRLSHLNFDYINLISKKDIVIGLPKLKLNLLHMDLCGPMRVASINGKKYILVIVDDYSRYTWTLFLCSKDETPDVLKKFLTMIQRNLQDSVITVRTDRDTEFLNKTLNAFFKEEGIEHQTSTARTPEQNNVVERRNRTLVEAARTMLSASQLPLFFWAEAIATACYTQNRSIIILTHGKTPYHIINDKKPSIKHLHIFGCICYITRDGKNLNQMKEKGDQCILVGYSNQSKGYRVYNKRTRMIVESIYICFDEIKEVSETSVANNTLGLLDLLFGPLYDEFFNAGSNPSMNIPSTSAPSTRTNMHAEENNNDQAEEGEQLQDDEFTNPFFAPVQEEAESSSHNIGNSNVPTFNQPQVFEYRWMKDHPLEQVRRNPSRPVQTRRQLATDLEMCMYALTEEVYVAQPDGFVDPDHPEKVNRLRKALYGLKQALRAWYDELSKFLTSKGFTKGLQIHQSPSSIFINRAKYTLEILHKHDMDKGQSIGTPMAMKPKLDADLSGNPGSSFELTGFSDADHAGCIDSRKSTSGGIQFLGDKLVSWMSKKQNCTAMSLAEAEYVMLSASCAQVITEYQLAYMFTKSLPKDRFKYLVRRIGMRCLTPAELEVLAKESA
nr:hypothetical protein [Tanacetum cinerariifolium]